MESRVVKGAILQKRGYANAGDEGSVVIKDDREEVFFSEVIVGAVLVHEAADGGDNRVGDKAAQAEMGDRILALEKLGRVFGVGLEISIGSAEEDGFRSSGGSEFLEG